MPSIPEDHERSEVSIISRPGSNIRRGSEPAYSSYNSRRSNDARVLPGINAANNLVSRRHSVSNYSPRGSNQSSGSNSVAPYGNL